MRPKEKKLKKHFELCGARFFLFSMDDFMNFNDFVFAVLHFFLLEVDMHRMESIDILILQT